MDSLSREDLVFMAKMAESTERYSDMAARMKEVVEKHTAEKPLSADERNLLSVSYKNIVGARRSSWRVISSIIERHSLQEVTSESEKRRIELGQQTLQVIEEELKSFCNEVIGLLSEELIERSYDDENTDHTAKVFYYKMKGDYYRYIAEVAKDTEKSEIISKAEKAYNGALEAGKGLLASDPVILGLALNFSVFYYEILDDKVKASALAQEAFDNAIKIIQADDGSQYNKDSELIMQLLRDNLSLWNESEEDPEDA